MIVIVMIIKKKEKKKIGDLKERKINIIKRRKGIIKNEIKIN